MKAFAESLELDYPILSDEEKEVSKAYGVLMKGRGMAGRVTIYIGADGVIKHIDRKVKPKSHGKDVAKKLEELKVTKKK